MPRLPRRARLDLEQREGRASGNAFCLKCHDAKAPTTQGSPGAGFRIDLAKKVVHAAFNRGDCLGCHDGGHSGDNLKLLKKSVVDLCYGCHERKDKDKFPHSAVVIGDCAVCHDPHTSDQPKLAREGDDPRDLLPLPPGRPHRPEGGPRAPREGLRPVPRRRTAHRNRNVLKAGEGKSGLLQVPQAGRHREEEARRARAVRLHAAATIRTAPRYGRLVPKKVNDLCIACHQAEGREARHADRRCGPPRRRRPHRPAPSGPRLHLRELPQPARLGQPEALLLRRNRDGVVRLVPRRQERQEP